MIEPLRPAGECDPSTRLYERAERLAGLGAWECELATERLIWTSGVYNLFGVDRDAPLKRATILGLYTDESRAAMEAMRAEVIASGRNLDLDAEIRTVRGERRWMRLWIDVEMAEGRPLRLFGAKQDVTRERKTLEELRKAAEHDYLTGLANRAAFDARYRAAIHDGFNHVAALALIDLDRFKLVNDELGHMAGDECLRQVAGRLRRAIPGALVVARIGGDEFAVLLGAPLGPARIRQMLRRACDALCKPVAWNGRAIDVGASIGATILGRPHLRKPTELFEEADAALYAAKAAGRRTLRIFGDDRLEPSMARTGQDKVA